MAAERIVLLPKIAPQASFELTCDLLDDQLADTRPSWLESERERPEINDLEDNRCSVLAPKVSVNGWGGQVDDDTQASQATPTFHTGGQTTVNGEADFLKGVAEHELAGA